MKEIEDVFKDNIDVPNIFSFDGEDWMYYGDDPEIERQLESIRDMWRGFKRAFKASEEALREAYKTIVNNNFTVNVGMREIAQKWLEEHPNE